MASQTPEQFIASFSPFVEALNEGAIIGGPGAVILYANQIYCDLIGRSHADLLGRTVFELYDKEGRREFYDIINQNRGSTQARYEFYIPNAVRGRVPVHVAVGSLDKAGAPPGMLIVTVTDITELKQAQSIIKKQAEELAAQARYLEREVRARSFELHEANFDAIYMLALAGEARDSDTGPHVRRIQHTSEAIAMELGLEMWQAVEIGYSSILHDVGKMCLSDRVLKKQGPLTESERMEMQRHTLAGERILGTRPFFEMARRIARSHHEAVDGTGYPDGLMRENIPISARIVSVADIYDALTHERTYKKAWKPEEAAQYIISLSEHRLDNDVVRAFMRLFELGEVQRLNELVNTMDAEPRISYLNASTSGVFRIPSGL